MEKYYANPIGKIKVRGEEMWIQLDQKLTVALRTLDGFSHLDVLWWFSDSDNEEMHSVLEIPQPYKSAPKTMGIFTVRSPVCLSPIALIAVGAFSIDYEAGVIRIAYASANGGTPVLDIKPHTPSLDRVQDPVMPGWCGNWPSSLEEPGEFDRELVFNFQYESRQNRVAVSWDHGGIG